MRNQRTDEAALDALCPHQSGAQDIVRRRDSLSKPREMAQIWRHTSGHAARAYETHVGIVK